MDINLIRAGDYLVGRYSEVKKVLVVKSDLIVLSGVDGSANISYSSDLFDEFEEYYKPITVGGEKLNSQKIRRKILCGKW